MRDPASTLTLLVAATVLTTGLAGCIGQVEDTAPDLPFDSFEKAANASADVFKPFGTSQVVHHNYSADVTHPAYNTSHAIPVDTKAAFGVSVQAKLQSGSMSDELTVRLLDANGTEMGSATLTPESNTARIATSSIPTAGKWSVQVSGQAVQASYSIKGAVEYPSDHPWAVKLFEPEDLDAVEASKQPIVFLLYDGEKQEPITNASVAVQSWSASKAKPTQAREQDPSHVDHGIYRGTIHPTSEGEWQIRLDVTVDGETQRFVVPIQVGG